MEKKRIVKLISLLIISLIIFQLVPSTIDFADGYQNHTQTTKVFFSAGAFHTDALLIGRENQKTPIHKVQFNNIFNCIPQISIEDFFDVQFSFQEIPFDYRRVIRQTNQHYFNGSKYKNSLFVV